MQWMAVHGWAAWIIVTVVSGSWDCAALPPGPYSSWSTHRITMWRNVSLLSSTTAVTRSCLVPPAIKYTNRIVPAMIVTGTGGSCVEIPRVLDTGRNINLSAANIIEWMSGWRSVCILYYYFNSQWSRGEGSRCWEDQEDDPCSVD